MVQFGSYLRRVLCKTCLIFPRINGPIIAIILTLPKPPWPRNLTLKKSSIPFAHQILSVCRRLTGGSVFLSPESFLFLPVCKIQSSWCYVSFMLVALRIWYLNKVRKSKEVLDSGFHVLDSGFQIPALQRKLKEKFPDSRFFFNSSKSIWGRGHLSIGRPCCPKKTVLMEFTV